MSTAPSAERAGTTKTGPFDPFDPLAPPRPPKAWVAWMFSAIWLIYLVFPLSTLFDGKTSVLAFVAALGCVVLFSTGYLRLAMVTNMGPHGIPDRTLDPRKVAWLLVMAGIALVMPIFADKSWVFLWIYVSTAAGYALPMGRGPLTGLRVGVLAGGVMALEASLLGVATSDWLVALIPAMISCVATMGMRRMQLLIAALREARAEVARLAATEERLRMARDLHDLAGHSLATITLKAELARKLLRVDQDKAEQQLLDLELVSREALADIREAVSGYRRATLAVEGASARTALAAAGVAADIDPSLALRSGELDPDVESALAWCLREAVTNVVRHSGARTCRIRLIDVRVDGEPSVTLEVVDDGPAPPSAATLAEGNGLSGLRERLAAVSADAALSAGPLVKRRATAVADGAGAAVAAGSAFGAGTGTGGTGTGGFRLAATVPVTARLAT